MICKRLTPNERPKFPKRAVITAGMPYGNKNLHFGHVGGMFIHADIFARFLRDRIGKDNVIFLSGTDCYGSAIVESYRKLQEVGYEGSLEEYVSCNHEKQKKTLENYGISLNFFGASALGEAGITHKCISAKVFRTLYENRYIRKLSVPQFYDEEKKMFLKLLSVSGVGAKMAINVLSGMSIKDLALAIASSDVKTLSKIKGLGKKTAERIIVELRESVLPDKNDISAVGSVAEAIQAFSADGDNAITALMTLGYTKAVAASAVNKAVAGGADTLEKIIADALRSLA